MKQYIFALILAIPGIMNAMEAITAEQLSLEAFIREIKTNAELIEAIEEHNVEKVRVLLANTAIDVNYQAKPGEKFL